MCFEGVRENWRKPVPDRLDRQTITLSLINRTGGHDGQGTEPGEPGTEKAEVQEAGCRADAVATVAKRHQSSSQFAQKEGLTNL